MGRHEKTISGSGRKSEPRNVRTTAVHEEDLILDVPEDISSRVSTPKDSGVMPEAAEEIPVQATKEFEPIRVEEAEAAAQPVRSEPNRTRRVQSQNHAAANRAPEIKPTAKPEDESRSAEEDEPRDNVKAPRSRRTESEKADKKEKEKKADDGKRSDLQKTSERKMRPADGDTVRPPKKKKKFGKFLLVYTLILLVIILAILIALWVFLANFQKKKDNEAAAEAEQAAIVLQEKQHAVEVRQAPQRAFETWLAGYTADDWTNLWYENRPESMDGRDRVEEYMAERFGSDSVQAYRSLSYTDETPVFVLKDGDETLATVTLTGSDVNWTVSDVELDLKGEKSASVEVAAGSKVFCNGIELGEEYAGETQSNFSYEPLKDQLVNPVSWTTYTVDGLLIEPELTAEPPEGCSVTKTAEGDFMLCLDDGDEADQYINRAVNFVKAYLNYYMNGYNGTWGNLYAALAYLTPGTQAYTDLQDSYNGVVWNTAYGNIDTSDTTASGVVIWADNCYSVDVTYDANCTYNGEAIDYADATMRIYFLETDSGFVISNYETL